MMVFDVFCCVMCKQRLNVLLFRFGLFPESTDCVCEVSGFSSNTDHVVPCNISTTHSVKSLFVSFIISILRCRNRTHEEHKELSS